MDPRCSWDKDEVRTDLLKVERSLERAQQDKTSSDMMLLCYCCHVDAVDAWLLSPKVKNDLLPLWWGLGAVTGILFWSEWAFLGWLVLFLRLFYLSRLQLFLGSCSWSHTLSNRVAMLLNFIWNLGGTREDLCRTHWDHKNPMSARTTVPPEMTGISSKTRRFLIICSGDWSTWHHG